MIYLIENVIVGIGKESCCMKHSIIPCHRVIGKDGSLVGYGGGLDRKRKLLELEGIDVVMHGKSV